MRVYIVIKPLLACLMACVFLALGACGTSTHDYITPESADVAAKAAAQDLFDEDYAVNIGDKVRITTFEQPNLSGEFVIDGSGNIAMPLLGAVKAAGYTQRQLEQLLTVRLANGYLVNPKISVDIIGYRSFYIVGEVQQPGSYDYVSSLNVLKAVAIAGGFTHRAVTNEFVIIRGNGQEQKKIIAKEETLVLPGDSIRVKERFF